MEKQENSQKLIPEQIEKKEQNFEHKQETNILKGDNSAFLSKVNRQISQKENSINNTTSKINNIRSEFGLEKSDEIPPSIQQTQDSIEKLRNSIEYLNEIPIEKGKYYRVTGISEILSIIKNKSLNLPTGSFYDRQILNQISKKSDYSIEELELINAEDSSKIKEIYNKYILNPNNEKGVVTLVARTKSNHGEIGFVKEGFFYNPTNKDSSHFGAPVIVGREETSVFEQGVHGSRHNLFNKDIESNKAVVLRDGTDAENFEYWLYEKDKGWYKNSFNELQKKFEKSI